jgi:flavin reductase
MTTNMSPELEETQGNDHPLVSREAFRDGMAHLPGAVNIITTDGVAGQAGFTATAVCAVSDTPPTLLVCLNRNSSAAPSFTANTALCVNTVGPEHRELAMVFGGKTPMSDRFAAGHWQQGVSSAPCLQDAPLSFDCRIIARNSVGTHDVLFCEVLDIKRRQSPEVSVYFARRFHDLA